MRKKIVAGNWKMNTTIPEGIDLVKKLNEFVSNHNFSEDKILMIAPPFTHLYAINEILDKKIILGAQNLAAYEKGAYTGEIAANMLVSAGAKFVIIGHSERRQYFNEKGEFLLKKVNLALSHNLQPVFCIGEKLEEREKDNHFQVIENQLNEVIFQLSAEQVKNVIIAYEPVWAIGTGKTATPLQAQEMHEFIRSLISKHFNEEIAENMTILYGGSVKPNNAKELFSQKDVDGGLVGGASLKAEDFWQIFLSL